MSTTHEVNNQCQRSWKQKNNITSTTKMWFTRSNNNFKACDSLPSYKGNMQVYFATSWHLQPRPTILKIMLTVNVINVSMNYEMA
jgi:hypothetical protein